MGKRSLGHRLDIAKRFAYIRKFLNISAADLLRSSGVTDSTEDQLDGDSVNAGTICVRDMQKICDTHKVSMDWLLHGDGDPFPEKCVSRRCYNIFEKLKDGTYKYHKTYSMNKGMAFNYLKKLKEKNGYTKDNRYIIVETDAPIKVYKEIRV